MKYVIFICQSKIKKKITSTKINCLVINEFFLLFLLSVASACGKQMDDLCRSCGHLCDEFVSINEEVDDKLSLSSSFEKLSAMMSECLDLDVKIKRMNNIEKEMFFFSK